MTIKEYWDNRWNDRLKDGYLPAMNRAKLAKLVYELSIRQRIDTLEKLDIGCGSGVHALILAGFNGHWKDRWTGIDLSHSVNFCKKYGFNAIQGDFFTHEFDRKFECFLMLDSLEHFMDHQAVAKRILELADKHYYVFINVPLYCSAHAEKDGAERVVSVGDVQSFFEALKITESSFNTEVYGSFGYPYMIAEGAN